jgi:hypothetical protein
VTNATPMYQYGIGHFILNISKVLQNARAPFIILHSMKFYDKKNILFADNAPPVAHPATTVFVMSCFARA